MKPLKGVAPRGGEEGLSGGQACVRQAPGALTCRVPEPPGARPSAPRPGPLHSGCLMTITCPCVRGWMFVSLKFLPYQRAGLGGDGC